MKINANYLKLKDNYLFSKISQKVRDYLSKNPESQVLRLGVGDVTRPLVPAVINAMQNAVNDMSSAATFKGYGDEHGYLFLREAIAKHYAKRGVQLTADEFFIGDGAKSDLANILDIFAPKSAVAIPNPVYPVYMDTNIMVGNKITYLEGTPENKFLPMPPKALPSGTKGKELKADIIYLCSPNNPSGAVYTALMLKEWVDFANACGAVILFDSAYEAFVTDKNLPTSIFEIEGSKTCAIELCSLSKTAGFTGTRCGYTVVPKELIREKTSLNKLWLRRQATKFNGVSYVVQRGAEAVFSDEGQEQIKEDIAYYLTNAKIIANTMAELSLFYTGGKNAPYVWFKTPKNLSSWEFFDLLLEKTQIIGTPGEGFGECGEDFFRFSAFGNRKDIQLAMKRFWELVKGM